MSPNGVRSAKRRPKYSRGVRFLPFFSLFRLCTELDLSLSTVHHFQRCKAQYERGEEEKRCLDSRLQSSSIERVASKGRISRPLVVHLKKHRFWRFFTLFDVAPEGKYTHNTIAKLFPESHGDPRSLHMWAPQDQKWANEVQIAPMSSP